MNLTFKLFVLAFTASVSTVLFHDDYAVTWHLFYGSHFKDGSKN